MGSCPDTDIDMYILDNQDVLILKKELSLLKKCILTWNFIYGSFTFLVKATAIVNSVSIF